MSSEGAGNKKLGTEKKDPIIQLRKHCPHIFERIFGELVSHETFLAVQKVPQWEIALSNTWKRRWISNMTQSSIWKMLCSRVMTYDPSLITRLGYQRNDGYRKLCQSIEEALKKIKRNLRNGTLRPTQEGIIDPAGANFFSPCFLTEVVVNHLHIFIVCKVGFCWRIEMYNRWTLKQTETSETIANPIRNLQLNNRVAIFQSSKDGADLINVLDVYTLIPIQTIHINQENTILPTLSQCDCFCLTEGFLYRAQMIEDEESLTTVVTIHFYPFNHREGCFGIAQTKNFSFIGIHTFISPRMYVDERYLILDYFGVEGAKWIRNLQVRCINTMNLVHSQHFRYSFSIDREYKDGKIMALVEDNQELFVVIWDIHNNTLERTIHAGDDFCNMFTALMTHFSDYQVGFNIKDPTEIKLVKKVMNSERRGQPTEIRYSVICALIGRDTSSILKENQIVYCDGAQIVATSNLATKLHVMDLI